MYYCEAYVVLFVLFVPCVLLYPSFLQIPARKSDNIDAPDFFTIQEALFKSNHLISDQQGRKQLSSSTKSCARRFLIQLEPYPYLPAQL